MNDAYIRLLIFLYTSQKASVDVHIAQVLLDCIHEFPNILIEDIARKAMTTPASVTKFCHKLQYKDFKELRYDYTHHKQEILSTIDDNLDYTSSCLRYVEEAHLRLQQYMHLYDEQMIFTLANQLHNKKEISIVYAPYAYTCTHVLRTYLEPHAISVRGIMRDLDEDFIEERSKQSDVLILISLQGDWILQHQSFLKKLKEKGKQLVIITSIKHEVFYELSEYVFSFVFLGDTILDTVTQISTLFAKLSFAYVNFPKVEKSESSAVDISCYTEHIHRR